MKFYCEECFEEMGNCLDDCKAAERDRKRSEFMKLAASVEAPPTGLLAGSPETAARLGQRSKGSL